MRWKAIMLHMRHRPHSFLHVSSMSHGWKFILCFPPSPFLDSEVYLIIWNILFYFSHIHTISTQNSIKLFHTPREFHEIDGWQKKEARDNNPRRIFWWKSINCFLNLLFDIWQFVCWRLSELRKSFINRDD